MQRITEIILFTILVTVFLNSQAIAAGQHWGDYQPGACDAETGKRKYSAILWDIPWGASWEDACEKMSAKIKEQNFAQPTQCINTGGHMWGEWLLTDPTCSKPVVDAGKQVGQHWGDYEHGACDADTGKRKYSAILWDIPGGTSWEDACNTMSSTINGFIFSKPTQCKVAGGHMWGEWVFADPTCAQPAVVAGKDIGSICKVTARNLNVDTQWQESELEALCQGTVDPYEPGQCYRMQENINLDYPVAFVEGTKAEKVSIGSDGSILRWNETDPNKIGWFISPSAERPGWYTIERFSKRDHDKEFMEADGIGRVRLASKAAFGFGHFRFRDFRATDGSFIIEVISTRNEIENVAVGKYGILVRWPATGGNEERFKLVQLDNGAPRTFTTKDKAERIKFCSATNFRKAFSKQWGKEDLLVVNNVNRKYYGMVFGSTHSPEKLYDNNPEYSVFDVPAASILDVRFHFAKSKDTQTVGWNQVFLFDSKVKRDNVVKDFTGTQWGQLFISWLQHIKSESAGEFINGGDTALEYLGIEEQVKIDPKRPELDAALDNGLVGAWWIGNASDLVVLSNSPFKMTFFKSAHDAINAPY